MINDDLFAGQFSGNVPLAARMRPRTIDEYQGQAHILGPGKALRRAIEAGQLHSMILWGPPGTGKTTLAEVIAHHSNAVVEKISAVSAGIKDLRAAIERAQGRQSRTLLFVDEVHRFNKAQQDALLPYIEDGTVVFIGATTENPSFEVNNALLSRARVYRLRGLDDEVISELLSTALTDPERGLDRRLDSLADEAKAALVRAAAGDARRALNLLEIAVDLAGDDVISLEIVAEAAGEQAIALDKQGDRYYDLISAFHKSVRGSSPDGALYWYACMLEGGVDPLYVARRLLAIASEDVGNADPRAMQVALSAWDCFQRVGPAEGERAIAQAAVYLAVAPKSNAVYKAFQAARDDVRAGKHFDVPLHLRNAPTKLMKAEGFGDEYRYAHDEPGAYAAGEDYFPEEMAGTRYYYPERRGAEIKINDKLAYLRDLDENAENQRYKR